MQEVKYADAYLARYKVTPVTTVNTLSQDLTNTPNIRLTKNNLNYNVFNQNTLVTVCGFYHKAQTDGVNGVMVTDAMRTLAISRENKIGIVSFKELCTLSIVPITDNMLLTNNNGIVRLNTGIDTSNKTILLSIGGYLTFVNPLTFKETGIGLYSIDFNNISILDRYYESKNYIDLSSLPVSFSPNNNNAISLNQFMSDTNLRAYMKLSQSFIIVLNIPTITITKQHVKKTGMPGMYIAYTKPEYPLVTNLGRHNEYWHTAEDGQYSITVVDNIVENRIYNTTILNSLSVVGNNRRPGYQGQLSDAYLLRISNMLPPPPPINYSSILIASVLPSNVNNNFSLRLVINISDPSGTYLIKRAPSGNNIDVALTGAGHNPYIHVQGVDSVDQIFIVDPLGLNGLQPNAVGQTWYLYHVEESAIVSNTLIPDSNATTLPPPPPSTPDPAPNADQLTQWGAFPPPGPNNDQLFQWGSDFVIVSPPPPSNI